jgi:hypothetical protein
MSVDWYKKQGPGYQTRITSLPRAYMKEHQRNTMNVWGHDTRINTNVGQL